MPATRLLCCCLAILAVAAPAVPQAQGRPGPAPATRAKQALLVEYDGNRVLLAKNADQRMAPSSLAKLMTAYLVFEELRAGRLTLDRRLRVGRRAARMAGSRMGLRAGSRVRVADLLRGLIVGSGNDAGIAVAEGLAGSEAAFARRMTARARSLGLRRSVFKTATGFSRPGQYVTARDIARLSAVIIRNFPDHYRYFGLVRFRYGRTVLRNRNPVLGRVRGADGLKTGQTRAGGFGIAASAVRGGRRLILVLNGLPSEAARTREAVRLLEWGFRRR